MKHSRLGVAMVVLTVLACMGGCGTVGNSISRFVSPPEQESSLAEALEYLRAGNEQKSRDILERVSVAPPVKGVTDEALFRLALISLRNGDVRAQELLERLKREYPDSIWSHQAAPLAAHLTGVRNLQDRQREIKTLRERNLSLTRDNKELRQSIERLKHLDLELEQRIKR